MSKIETFTIGDVSVTVHKKTVRQGLRLQTSIMNILGKGAGKALAPLIGFAMTTEGTAVSDDMNELKASISEKMNGFDFSQLGEAVSDILGKLDVDVVDRIIDELSNGVFVNGLDLSDPDKFELAFEDKYDLLYKVFGKVIAIQFKGFFSFLSIFNIPQKEENTLP